MTALLLDTHALLWWFNDPDSLTSKAYNAIDAGGRVLVSSVSIYEIAFKNRLGKLGAANHLLADLDSRLEGQGFGTLAIDHRHALAAGRLDPRHRDPFDRLLMAQALVERVELVSNEKLFESYGVRRLW